MTITSKGTAYIFGVPDEVKPIHGLPRGKMRLRLRHREWAKVFVRAENSIVGFHLVNCGSHWALGAKVGENHRARV